MINKIRFYRDNIRRFERNQLFHLILHRIKTKFSGILGYSRLKKIQDTDLISLELFKEKFDTLCTEDGKMIWDLHDSETGQDIEYFTELKSNILRNLDSPQELWSIRHEDLEVSNNHERFYLFAEAFIALGTTPSASMSFLKKFMESNEKRSEKCWNGFNITIRLINWLKIFYYYRDYLNEEEWISIQKYIFKHYSLLKMSIEKHIPGNHVLYQFFVLWLVSNLFPEWEKEKEWDHYFIKEINKQFLTGGLHFELGYHYHVQTTIVVLYWFIINQKAGRKIPVNISEKIRNAVESVDRFILPDGTIPMIGDNCYCFFHQRLREDIENIKSLSSKLRTYSKASERGISNISDRYLISEFPNSKIILDVGELGYKSNPGHGHSDLLSFIYYQKAPIFIDPGTRRYSDLREDIVLKKSISHNTLTINSESQAELGTFFRWAYLPENINFNFTVREEEHILSGSYSGFRQIGPFVHNRKIVHKNDYLEIEDYVPGDTILDLELNFILHPGISAERNGLELLLKNSDYTWTVRFISEEKFSIKLLPTKVFASYSQGTPSHRINLSFCNIKLPFKCKTTLFPN